MTRELTLWRYLCRNPHQRPRDLAAALGWKEDTLSKTLRRLKDKGCARSEGLSHLIRWRATELKPSDGRGLGTGCAKGRALGATYENIKHANNVRLARIADGSLVWGGWKRKEQRRSAKESSFVGKTALELCWSPPLSIEQTLSVVKMDNGAKARRGPSCVETPEDKEAA